jgi:hypothetical protein
VDYERERDELSIEGLVAIGGVTLAPNDAIPFLGEIKKIAPASSFRIDLTGKNFTIFPRIEFGYSLKRRKEEERIPKALGVLNMVFSELEKVEELIMKYRKKEVGYPEVERIWSEALKTTDINEKGRLLEEVFLRLFQLDGSFVVIEHNVRTESEQIDLVVQPDATSPFWSRVTPPMILLECKNWKDRIGTKEVQVFATKIENRPRILCRIGYLVSISGFTSDAEKELIGYRARDFIMATITADHIVELAKNRKRISDLLKERLVEAGFR